MDGAGILSLEAFRDYSGSFFHFFIPKKRSFFGVSVSLPEIYVRSPKLHSWVDSPFFG